CGGGEAAPPRDGGPVAWAFLVRTSGTIATVLRSRNPLAASYHCGNASMRAKPNQYFSTHQGGGKLRPCLFNGTLAGSHCLWHPVDGSVGHARSLDGWAFCAERLHGHSAH